MWGDESEDVVPIIWLYQIVDAQNEEVFFPELLITLWSYDQPGSRAFINTQVSKAKVMHEIYIF